MKLRKIHLSNDRILSGNDMKFVVGGGDEHTQHDGSWIDCPECKKAQEAIYNGGNTVTNGKNDNWLVSLEQGLMYGFSMLYHYGYQAYQSMFGNNEDDENENNEDASKDKN